MNGLLNNKKIIISILLISFILLLTGCGILRRRPEPNESNPDNEKKDPPKSLNQMEEETDNMIKEIETVRERRARMEREEMQPSEEEEAVTVQQNGQNGDEEDAQDKNEEDESPGDEEQDEDNQKPEPIPQVDWNSFEDTVESLHVKWNSFEPQARQDGASEDTVKSFELQLNALTEQIMARNEDYTLIAANKLYSHFSDFLNMYKHQQPPEVKEVKYLTRQIIIDGRQDKWDETNEMLSEMKKAWQTAKARMDKPDKNLNQRIDSAINDFSYVVSEKKINLARLNGDIIINNLENIK